MTPIQKFFTTLLPKAWAESMEAESRQWKAHCPCGHSRAIWDLGGIRWKAYGEPRRLMTCPACQQRTWHVVRKG